MGLLLALLLNKSFAQLSKPMVTNYQNNHLQVNFQVFDIEQDTSGRMYFATSKGVVLYNGTKWDKINETSGIPFRIMKVGPDEKIYLAGEKHFGFLTKKKNDQYSYYSISDSIKEKTFVRGNIRDIVVVNADSILFIGDDVTLYETKKKSLTILLSYYNVSAACFYNNKLLVAIPHKGIFEVDGPQNLIPYINDPHFARSTFVSIRFKYDYLIAVTQNEGVHILNKSKKLLKSVPIPFEIRDVSFVEDFLVAIATKKGVYIYNLLTQKIEYIIDSTIGLTDEDCLSLKTDRQFNLWIGTTKGISKTEVFLPFSFYSEESGLNGEINDIVFLKDKLYIASNFGIFQNIKTDTTHKSYVFAKINANIPATEKLEIIDSTVVFVAEKSIYYLKKNHSFQKIDTVHDIYGKIFNIDGFNFFVYSKEGVYYFKKCIGKECAAGHWSNEKISNAILDDIVSIDDDHLLCLSQGKLMTAGISYNGDTKFEIGKKIVSENTFLSLYKAGNEIFALTKKGIVQIFLDVQNNVQIIDCSFLDNQFNMSDYNKSFFQKSNNYYYIVFSGEKTIPKAFYRSKNQKSSKFIPLTFFRRLPSLEIKNIVSDINKPGYFYICTENGLVEFKSIIPIKEGPRFNTIITNVYMEDDMEKSIIHTPNIQIAYNSNTITFEFSSTNFILEDLNEYSYKLEGFNTNWSPWTEENKVTFAKIPEGQYTFKVKSKNLYNQESKVHTFKFTIRAPWYRTTWAYLIYTFLFLIGIVVFIHMYTKRLQNANLKLQKIIDQRTVEILKQKHEIEEKNKNITSSIEYARTIQDAILTSRDYLKAVLGDYFVYYNPKDIIGGDFYWAYQATENKVIVAVADCTGHGVPGALMSMIGNSLLNEIIVENKIEETNLILDQLRNGIINTFQHTNTTKIERSHDGMDISLICIDTELKIMEYSCAKQQIFVVRKNELIELETDFQPISNFVSNLEPYRKNLIQLEDGDCVYLFTDGYSDQFGGEKGKKYMQKQFKELVRTLYSIPMETQGELLESAFETWRGSHDQVDDVCVIGFRIG